MTLNLLVAGMVALLSLSACQSEVIKTGEGNVAGQRELGFNIEKVTFPGSIKANAPLPIDITVGDTCGFNVDGYHVDRTAIQVDISPYHAMTEAQYQQLQRTPCTPMWHTKTVQYIDPGTPTRQNPFYVYVDGKLYGTVEVLPAH